MITAATTTAIRTPVCVNDSDDVEAYGFVVNCNEVVIDDIEIIQRGYAAFGAGDVATLTEVFDPAVTWHVPGGSALSGAKQGLDATLSHFGALVERTGGTFRAELKRCLADGHGHVLALGALTAQREQRTLDVQEGILFTIRDDRVLEAVQTVDDVDAFDAFWTT